MEFIPQTFGIESLYPPTGISATQVRELYNRLADPCRFTEFKQLGEGQGARLAEGTNRHLTVTTDRIVYRDDFTQRLFSAFRDDVLKILEHLRAVFSVPVLLHTKVLVRLLMPEGGSISVASFQQSLLRNARVSGDTFGRPLSGTGLRLVFPPSKENHSTFHLRIEPYFRDNKLFFLENSAQFFDPLVQTGDITRLLDETYDFAKEKGGPFLLSLGEGGYPGTAPN